MLGGDGLLGELVGERADFTVDIDLLHRFDNLLQVLAQNTMSCEKIKAMASNLPANASADYPLGPEPSC